MFQNTAARVAPEKTDFSARPAAVSYLRSGKEKSVKATTYGQKLRDPRWQKRRLEVMQRDEFTCRMCGDNTCTLNVHHLAYSRGKNPWDTDMDLLVTLCEWCHEEWHDHPVSAALTSTLMRAGAMSQELWALNEWFGYISDGPSPRKYTEKEWGVILAGIQRVLEVAPSGVTEAALGKAIDDCADKAQRG